MPFTFAKVHTIAMSLPDVTVGTSWGHRTWMVHNKGFAWHRPFTLADRKRFREANETPPDGEILGVRTEDLDAKDALLAMDLPGFFTIEHFNCYPAILIALGSARAADVRMAIEQAYRAVASSRPAKARKRVRKRP